MSAHDDAEQVQPERIEDWAAWLEANHDSATGAWLVTWKRSTGRQAFPYVDGVVEALRFGWIDGTLRSLDGERTAQYYAPRRPGSGWAATNKARIERLEAEGRMHPAGAAVVERARADGSWSKFDDIEALVVPDDLRVALDAHPGAAERWEALAPSARKMALHWVGDARRPETRAKRIAETVARTAAGERPR